MADYCSLDDAEAVVPTITVTASTVPTTTQAGAYPTHITSELNVLLRSKGFALPITDTEMLAELKAIAINGVIAMLIQAKFGAEPAANYWQLYREGKQAIRNLEVAPDGVNNVHFGEGFSVDADGVAREPIITRSEVIW